MLGIFTGEPMGPVREPLGESKRLLVSVEGAHVHLEDVNLYECFIEGQFWPLCFTL